MSTLSAAAKVFNIPELSEIILQDFTPHDFAQCILVCKSFASVFTPILWHTISLKQDHQHAWFSTSLEVQEALRRNAHYVQVIQGRSCKSLRPFLELGEMMMPRLHTVQFPLYNRSLGSYATDDLHPDPVFSEQQRLESSVAAAGATRTGRRTRMPRRDWLRYNGMFLMRRRYFIDRVYRQRQLHAFQQQRVAQQQLLDIWKHTNDPNYIVIQLREAEEKVAQLEQECVVQEKKFPSVALGLGPSLVEQDLELLRSKIRQTKEKIDKLRRASPPIGAGLVFNNNDDCSAGSWMGGEPDFCMGYENTDELILEQFLRRFPHLQTLMTTSLPFVGQGVIRTVVGLDNLRSLSLTIFHAKLPTQVSNVHTLLSICPPNLEILRLSFVDKDDGTVDMMPVIAHPRGRNSASTLPTAEMLETSTYSFSASGPTPTTNSFSSKGDVEDASLDLVRLSIQRAGPMRFLRRLFIEGTLGDPALTKISTFDRPSPDSQTWVAFLERCPNLLTLSLGGCSVRVLPEVGQFLRLYCPRLEDFAVGHKSYLGTPSYELLDPNLAILLSSLVGLKRLRIDSFALETNSQVLGVIQHRFAESLTDISLNDCKYLRLRFLEESHSVFSLLQSLKNMESMDLLPSGEIFHSFEHTLGCPRFVSEVFSKPWTCQGSLRVLRINIDGVFRKVPTYSLTREQDLENSRQLQRKACQFLGSFSQLEELSLGVLTSAARQKATARWRGGGSYKDEDDTRLFSPSAEDHEQGPVYGAFRFVGIQSTCLALSLTHGLELMGGLKRLKIFNVARMDHSIETEEVEFMVEQWPELEFLPGLLRGSWFQGEPGRPEGERVERTRQVEERDRKVKLACSRFFNISELVLTLTSLLDRGAIANLCLTDHRLKNICTPLLYSVQDFFTETAVSIAQILDTPEAMAAFARNIQSIHQVTSGPLFASFYYNCMLLAHTAVAAASLEDLEQDSSGRPLLTAAGRPISQNPSGSDILDPTTKKLVPLAKVLPTLRGLKRLDFTITTDLTKDLPQLVPTLVFSAPESVECLEMELDDIDEFGYDQVSVIWDERDPQEQSLSSLAAVDTTELLPKERTRPRDVWTSERRQERPLIHLRRLYIDSFAQVSPIDMAAIFAHCPALVDLHIPDLDEHADVRRVARSIAQSCPRISQVLQHGRVDDEQQLTLEIARAVEEQKLEGLLFSGFQGSDDLIPVMLQRHSTVLRELRLNDCIRLSSKSIQKVLCTGRVLEVFRVEPYRPALSCIFLEDAVATEWVCKDIKQLRLEIKIGATIPPSPDAYYKRVEEEAPLVLTEVERAHFSLLETLYRQIASLTKLEHLDIRTVVEYSEEIACRYSYHDVSFPGMLSLGDEKVGRPGYLDLFGGLKKLRSLNGSVRAKTDETRVMVGQRECEWLSAHWPLLEVLDLCSYRPGDDFLNDVCGRDERTCFRWLKERRKLNLKRPYPHM
ncbi:hypothetical protein BGZ47_002484 [Haplosporangium gracile]|nr:hypothetical protein BGZ47_002484 [Haplosporangium gracile]